MTSFLRTEGMLTTKTCHDSLLYLPTSFTSRSEQCFWKRGFDKDHVQKKGSCVTRGLESVPSKEWLRQLDMVPVKRGHGFSWEILTGSHLENITNFSHVTLKGRRGHKIYKGRTSAQYKFKHFHNCGCLTGEQTSFSGQIKFRRGSMTGRSSAGKIETPDWMTSRLPSFLPSLLHWSSLLKYPLWGELTSANEERPF